MPRVTAGADVSGLRLDLALPKSATAQSYSALLRTAEGVETWSARDLRVDPANRTMLPIELPLEGLPEADYELELSGEGPHGARRLAEYRFRLLRE